LIQLRLLLDGKLNQLLPVQVSDTTMLDRIPGAGNQKKSGKIKINSRTVKQKKQHQK